MHSLRIIGLGIFFALAGLGLFALTLRKRPQPATPPKKSELRQDEIRQQETTKLRIAAAACVAVGALMMVFS